MHRNNNCFATKSKEYMIETKHVQCLAFFFFSSGTDKANYRRKWRKLPLYCPNKHIFAKKHSIKAHLGRNSEKATHKKLPKMLIDYISPGRNILLIRLLMNERQLKITE